MQRSRISGAIAHGAAPLRSYDGAVKRLLTGLAVTVLIVAGVGAAIIVLSSRDGGSLDHSAASGPTTPAGRPETCTRTGNVVIKYSAAADAIRIDQLAEQLGAIDTQAARTAGQAIIAKPKDGLEGVVAVTSCQEQASFPSVTDPQLQAFVRQYLGNKEPVTG